MSGATGVAADTAVTLSFNEPIEPATVHLASFTLRDWTTSRVVAGSYQVSADRRQASVIPAEPLWAQHTYQVELSTGAALTDLAGNAAARQTFSFTTGAAPGTDLTTLPTGASVTVNPPSLFADGQSSAQVTLSNVNRNGTLVPNGTRLGVTVVSTTFADSAGGTLSGGVPSAADPAFQVVTTLDGGATLTYRSLDLSDLPPGSSRTATVQVVSLDTADRPVRLIGSASVTLFRSASATVTSNPTWIRPDNSCFADVTVTIVDNDGNPVPVGTRFAVTADPVFAVGSAGGTMSGSECSASSINPRFLLCDIAYGGTLTVQYAPPTLSLLSGETRTATIQAAAVNTDEEITGVLGARSLSLRNDGLCTPQPVLGVAGVSPASGETGVGLNAPVVAKFSQPLDPASVTSANFYVQRTSPNCCQTIPGTLVMGNSPKGANTVVTFIPTNPLAPKAGYAITVTTGIRSAEGNPLANSFYSSFTTGLESDSTAPAVVQISPREGKTDVSLNTVMQVEFSEPMRPASLTAESFRVEVGAVPIGGQVSVGNGAQGPNTLATFRPDGPLAPNTAFTIRLMTAVTDTAGNPLEAEFTSTFGTATAGDLGRPKVVSVDPASGSLNVLFTAAVSVRFSEPVSPITVNASTFFVSDSLTGLRLAGGIAFSEGDTVATITFDNPLFTGRGYTVRVTQEVRDVASNRLLNAFSSYFSVPMASGTGSLPTSATVLINPPILFADGRLPTTVTVSNINRKGTLVANGALVAVTAEPAFSTYSAGGLISGSSVGPSPDGRFLLFETVGASINLFYTPQDLTGLARGQSRTAVIQIASVDAGGRPVNLVGQGSVTLVGIDSATVVANPASLPANGTSTSTITVTVNDREGNLVPDGTPVGLTVAPIYSVTTAGGMIIDGTTSTADPRVQLFTTADGRFTATYRPPTSRGSGTAVIQVLTVDLLERPTSLATTANISLQ
ncbi:MAG: hypothetical protein FIA90_06035 [candidate division NC10 bacterium]|nr:hypothetical protein [candidate division NC10 bacterium]